MKHVHRLLVILVAVMTLMILTASIAMANPGAGGDGIENAKDRLGEDPPAVSNGNDNGGLVQNPADADMGPDHKGQDAMDSQIDHNPLCSAHEDH